MKTLILTAALLLSPALAHAQVGVAVHFGWTAPPPLVEVSPGVQVVEDAGDEIFFTNGRYWVERAGRWYWAADFREHWVPVRIDRVPLFVRNHRRGEYLHWRRAEHLHAAERRDLRREEVRHEERGRDYREERRDDRRE